MTDPSGAQCLRVNHPSPGSGGMSECFDPARASENTDCSWMPFMARARTPASITDGAQADGRRHGQTGGRHAAGHIPVRVPRVAGRAAASGKVGAELTRRLRSAGRGQRQGRHRPRPPHALTARRRCRHRSLTTGFCRPAIGQG